VMEDDRPRRERAQDLQGENLVGHQADCARRAACRPYAAAPRKSTPATFRPARPAVRQPAAAKPARFRVHDARHAPRPKVTQQRKPPTWPYKASVGRCAVARAMPARCTAANESPTRAG
jgi:hypothetical protein